MRKPNAVFYGKKNKDIIPFEDTSKIEFICKKHNASLFTIASHSKKKPHNLVFGRLFDGELLDMIEFGIVGGVPMELFKSVKVIEI